MKPSKCLGQQWYNHTRPSSQTLCNAVNRIHSPLSCHNPDLFHWKQTYFGNISKNADMPLPQDVMKTNYACMQLEETQSIIQNQYSLWVFAHWEGNEKLQPSLSDQRLTVSSVHVARLKHSVFSLFKSLFLHSVRHGSTEPSKSLATE